jgi:hypothetical protein
MKQACFYQKLGHASALSFIPLRLTKGYRCKRSLLDSYDK